MVVTYKCARCERVVVLDQHGWSGGMVNDLCFPRSGKPVGNHEWKVVGRR